MAGKDDDNTGRNVGLALLGLFIGLGLVLDLVSDGGRSWPATERVMMLLVGIVLVGWIYNIFSGKSR